MTVSTTHRRRAPLIAVLALFLLALAGAGTASAQTAPAPTNPSGFVRLGHLAPDVGPVDVYLAPFGGQKQAVIHNAPYGTLTPYQTLAPGDYTVAMRPAGTPPSTTPMLSSRVSVNPGAAYTVLATGRMGALKTSVIDDNLTPPPADAARVRLVQGSPTAQHLTVAAVAGPTLAATSPTAPPPATPTSPKAAGRCRSPRPTAPTRWPPHRWWTWRQAR